MIGWRDEHGQLHRGSLFGALAALARGEAWSFPALRAHQREPWHAFTVQVAALALIRAGIDALPGDEPAWRDLLLGLTPDQPEAWELVVDDWSKPALLQPPIVAAGNRADYKSRLATPDALDMLVTAKNHDLKKERIVAASKDDWLFALVTLQTASAYGGAKTYGSSRMNGKTGSRLITRVQPAGGAANSFRRDVRLLASAAASEGDLQALVWLQPSDGLVSIGYHLLAPSLYVDCARRVRLVEFDGSIHAEYATSETARVYADAAAGVTGDPYAPVKPDRSASLTPKRETFGYRGTCKVLTSDIPLLAKVHADDSAQGLRIRLSALVRKGGTDTNTEGLHERVILTSRVDEIGEFFPDRVLDQIGNTAKLRAEDAGDAAVRLRRALICLVQGGPDKARQDDDASKKKVVPWIDRFDTLVDRSFFDDDFWADAAEVPGGHKITWRQRLRGWAEEVFADAAEAAPRTAMRRVRAIARARSMLDAQMFNWIKELA